MSKNLSKRGYLDNKDKEIGVPKRYGVYVPDEIVLPLEIQTRIRDFIKSVIKNECDTTEAKIIDGIITGATLFSSLNYLDIDDKKNSNIISVWKDVSKETVFSVSVLKSVQNVAQSVFLEEKTFDKDQILILMSLFSGSVRVCERWEHSRKEFMEENSHPKI